MQLRYTHSTQHLVRKNAIYDFKSGSLWITNLQIGRSLTLRNHLLPWVYNRNIFYASEEAKKQKKKKNQMMDV